MPDSRRTWPAVEPFRPWGSSSGGDLDDDTVQDQIVAVLQDGESVVLPAVRTTRFGSSTVGVFRITDEKITYRPAVDLRFLGPLVIAAAAGTVAAAAAVARRPVVGPVTMGPGGWLSVRENERARPASGLRLRPAEDRPWWAKLLRAHRLVVER